MEKEQLLVETFEGVPVAITEVTDDGYRYATFVVSKGDYVNRNNRAYPLSIWKREASRIKRSNVTGQAGHPSWMSGTNPLDQFLLFREGEVDGIEFRATARVMPTEEGEKFATLAEGGMKFAVSTRGRGSVKRVEKYKDYKKVVHADVAVVQDDYKLRGIDLLCSDDGSVQGARMLRLEAVEESNMDELQEQLDAVQKELDEAQAKVAVLNERIEQLEGENKELSEAAEARDKEAGEKEAELSEKDAEVEELNSKLSEVEGELEEARGKVDELTEIREKSISLEAARYHLLEKVSGNKFALPILKRLFDTATADEVDNLFDSVVAEINDELSGIPDGKPKGKVEGSAGDDLKEDEEDEPTPHYRTDYNRPHLRAGGLR